MSVKMIVAVDKNFGIGYENKLLFNIPEDMKFFRQKTSDATEGKPELIMGRKTYESIGRPLPKRVNIVISKDPEKIPIPKMSDGTEFIGTTMDNIKGLFNSKSSRIPNFATRNIWIIGGDSIYKQLLKYTNEIYMTMVDAERKADTYFPNISGTFEMKEVLQEGEFDGIRYKMTRWQRIKTVEEKIREKIYTT